MGGRATGSMVLYQPPKALIEVFISSMGGEDGEESNPKAILRLVGEGNDREDGRKDKEDAFARVLLCANLHL